MNGCVKINSAFVLILMEIVTINIAVVMITMGGLRLTLSL